MSTTSSSPFAMSYPDHCYTQAADQILVGSSIPKDVQYQITRRAPGMASDKWLIDYIGDGEFDWPWFDEWMERFTRAGTWPESWEIYEDAPPPYRKVGDVLRSLTVPKLRALARDLCIDLGAAKKVTELRVALVRKVKWENVADVAESLNAEAQAKLAATRIKVKRQLLVRSLSHRAYSLYRHEQIVDLLDSAVSKYKVRVENIHDCPVARRLAKGWEFCPRDTLNLPPFFPGDATGIRTERV